MTDSDSNDFDDEKATAADIIINNQSEIIVKLNKLIDYNRQVLSIISKTENFNVFDYKSPEPVKELSEEKKAKTKKEIYTLALILFFLVLITVALAVYFYYRD